eukprot:GHVP01002933.1.p1 GENE.GHVP01002933.1~~GHVP01002933.1.p1  ORF type:complete len:949 (+),score=187.72 GHVP01002933.1:360-3206(+)
MRLFNFIGILISGVVVGFPDPRQAIKDWFLGEEAKPVLAAPDLRNFQARLTAPAPEYREEYVQSGYGIMVEKSYYERASYQSARNADNNCLDWLYTSIVAYGNSFSKTILNKERSAVVTRYFANVQFPPSSHFCRSSVDSRIRKVTSDFEGRPDVRTILWGYTEAFYAMAARLEEMAVDDMETIDRIFLWVQADGDYTASVLQKLSNSAKIVLDGQNKNKSVMERLQEKFIEDVIKTGKDKSAVERQFSRGHDEFHKALQELRSQAENVLRIYKSRLPALKQFGAKIKTKLDGEGAKELGEEEVRYEEKIPPTPTKAMAKQSRIYIKKMKKAENVRLGSGDFRPSLLPTERTYQYMDVHPRALLTMKIDHKGLRELLWGGITGYNVHPQIREKYEAYQASIKRWVEVMAPHWYNTVDKSIRRLLWKGTGLSCQAELKAEIICAYHDQAKAVRIVERLFAKIPELTNDWVLVGHVFDSAEDDPYRAEMLVKEYAEAMVTDAVIKSPHKLPTNILSKGMCSAQELFSLPEVQYERLTEMCVQYPPFFNLRDPFVSIFPMCLDAYPVGTKFHVRTTTRVLESENASRLHEIFNKVIKEGPNGSTGVIAEPEPEAKSKKSLREDEGQNKQKMPLTLFEGIEDKKALNLLSAKELEELYKRKQREQRNKKFESNSFLELSANSEAWKFGKPDSDIIPHERPVRSALGSRAFSEKIVTPPNLAVQPKHSILEEEAAAGGWKDKIARFWPIAVPIVGVPLAKLAYDMLPGGETQAQPSPADFYKPPPPRPRDFSEKTMPDKPPKSVKNDEAMNKNELMSLKENDLVQGPEYLNGPLFEEPKFAICLPGQFSSSSMLNGKFTKFLFENEKEFATCDKHPHGAPYPPKSPMSPVEPQLEEILRRTLRHCSLTGCIDVEGMINENYVIRRFLTTLKLEEPFINHMISWYDTIGQSSGF